MTREDALQKLKQPAYDPETIMQDFEYVATKLGISKADLQSHMDMPNKPIKIINPRKIFIVLVQN